MEKTKAMKWVKALRSGKYKQGKEELFCLDSNTYCCLGVLGRINEIDNETLIDAKGILRRFLKEKCDLKDGSGTPINEDGEPIQIKMNIKGDHLKEYDSLVELNDHGASFKRIATWIEKNYKLL